MTIETTADATQTTAGGTAETAPEAATAAETAGQETAATAASETASAGAPESYSFVAPEGQEYDSVILASYSEVAKSLDLPQDKAQAMLEKMSPVIAARQSEQLAAAQAGWLDSAKSDKEYGGDKLPQSLAVAQKAMEAFATPELKSLFEATGLGNHPEIVRFMVRAGNAISEDKHISGRNSGAAPAQTMAQRMYPNMNP